MENLLHEVAKVSVDSASLNSPLLSQKRRRELRTEAIKEYIKRKPYGQRIKMQEFKEVGRFGTKSNANIFLKGMLKRGEIVRHDISPRRFFYTVPTEVKVTREAAIRIDTSEVEKALDQPTASATPSFEDVATEEDGRYRAGKAPQVSVPSALEAQAMHYLYYYGPEADNVRDFLRWVNSQPGSDNG